MSSARHREMSRAAMPGKTAIQYSPESRNSKPLAISKPSDGEVIGAVGVTGDTEDRDEELAAHGIHAVGLKTDEDCEGMGRGVNVRRTK